ncbi:MAG TPA: serine protease [Pseudogracilibacillus sp.]|nr:serine protease [Pseudogracilibacillus sp.]
MDRENNKDIIDKDLYEEIDDEEMYELVQKAREEALLRERKRKEAQSQEPRFPRWVFWLIAFAMLLYVGQLFPQTVSIPAVEFLKTSAKLSTLDEIKDYKRAVVVIETNDGRGTGFAFTDDGYILTNYHVIEGYHKVTVAFQEDGLFAGEVVETYPEIDLAVLETDATDVPYLPLASTYIYEADEHIYFIGNPLHFTRIANEGTVLDYTYVRSKTDPVVMLQAPVYRGNSGSPVINDVGEVIGVIFATLDDDDVGRVGLFIPIDYYYAYKNEE